MKCILISGRTLQQGTSLEVGKTSEEYFRNVAVAFMNEDDMKEIGAEEGKTVRVSTKFGSTVVLCKKSKLDRGMIFMPFGPWTSVLIGIDTQGTGMPDSKGIEAEVSSTDEKLSTVPDILNTLGDQQ
ncbi:MAG: molybdopterin dinucleotide binding domain-containing protein [Thermodesulfobacteriota bacterium]